MHLKGRITGATLISYITELVLTLFRMGLIEGAHRGEEGEGGGAKRLTSLKSVAHILQQ